MPYYDGGDVGIDYEGKKTVFSRYYTTSLKDNSKFYIFVKFSISSTCVCVSDVILYVLKFICTKLKRLAQSDCRII